MGQMSFLDCLALTVCICLGAILGSFGVYVYHLPHFVTLPEPAPVNAEDALLRSRDAVSRNALKYACLATSCGSLPAGCVSFIANIIREVAGLSCASAACSSHRLPRGHRTLEALSA